MKVKIRPAREFDLPEVLSIENRAINLETEKTLSNAYNNPNYYIFVAEAVNENDDKAIIGFVELSLSYDESEIISIAVDERFRHQKVATNLLNVSFDKLAGLGAKKTFLDVRASNDAAISLYALFDFKKLTVRKNYYKNADGTKEDALVLIKQL